MVEILANAVWALVFCGTLVIFMQAGFILFEGGCISEPNRPGIAIKNLFMLVASMAGYLLVGYRFMWGTTTEFLVGNPMKLGESVPPMAPHSFQFYQMGFAIVAATIISGAMAGRSQLRANVIAALVMTTIVFPVMGHWVWGGGWLSHFKVHDFAGSGVVHIVGGAAAAAGAWVVGPRRKRSYAKQQGRGRKDPELRLLREDPRDPQPLARPSCPPLGPRELTLASYGLVLLTVGWMGFNGANAGYKSLLDSPDQVGFFFLSTCLSAVGGLFCVTVVNWGVYFFQRHRVPMEPFAAIAGGMSGMVAFTAVCDQKITLLEAIGVGVIGGVAYYALSRVVTYTLQIDDPVDAIAVHVGGGIVGVMAATMADGATWFQ